MLREFFLLQDDKYFGSWFWSNPLDVMDLATFYFLKHRHKLLNFKLVTVCDALDIELDDTHAHTAIFDIAATYKLYKKITT
jgi:DNA polymerase-3 subunit epsilon